MLFHFCQFYQLVPCYFKSTNFQVFSRWTLTVLKNVHACLYFLFQQVKNNSVVENKDLEAGKLHKIKLKVESEVD